MTIGGRTPGPNGMALLFIYSTAYDVNTWRCWLLWGFALVGYRDETKSTPRPARYGGKVKDDAEERSPRNDRP